MHNKPEVEMEMTNSEFKDFAIYAMTVGPDGTVLSDTVKSIKKVADYCICYDDDRLIGILEIPEAIEWLTGENVKPFTLEDLLERCGMN